MSSGKTKLIFRIAALVVLSVALIILWLRSKSNEPSYHGRSLSQWLDQLDDGTAQWGVQWSTLPKKTAEQLEAAEAIRAIGTNAIPSLLKGLYVTDSFFYDKKEELLDYLKSTREHLMSPAQLTRWKSALALEALGPLAEPSAPELEKILITENSMTGSGKEAAYVLGGMGPKGISILTNAVQAGTDWAVTCALWSLGQHPTRATNLISFLAALTAHTNLNYAYSSIWVLGEIHGHPRKVVPALLASLHDPRSNVRAFAAMALRRHGAEAKEALPELNEFLSDTAIAGEVELAIGDIELSIRMAEKTKASLK
ncbi:MAG: putative domain containing protein [Verrucomicrobiales bacterium]|nr:putative domain containing protein [Verrucomicrobiales bacterium]